MDENPEGYVIQTEDQTQCDEGTMEGPSKQVTAPCLILSNECGPYTLFRVSNVETEESGQNTEYNPDNSADVPVLNEPLIFTMENTPSNLVPFTPDRISTPINGDDPQKTNGFTVIHTDTETYIISEVEDEDPTYNSTDNTYESTEISQVSNFPPNFLPLTEVDDSKTELEEVSQKFSDDDTDTSYVPPAFVESTSSEDEEMKPDRTVLVKRRLFQSQHQVSRSEVLETSSTSEYRSTDRYLTPSPDTTRTCDSSDFVSEKSSSKIAIAACMEIYSDSSLHIETKEEMHKGINYECNLCELDGKLIGFLKTIKPGKDHICERIPPGNTKWTYMVIRRKSNKSEVTVQVVYCSPVAKFEGQEIEVQPGELISPLYLCEPSQDTTAHVKRHCCYFCKKLFVKISRHIISQHNEEPQVQSLVELEPNSAGRNAALKRLRLEGDAEYNKKVLMDHRLTTRKSLIAKTSEYLNCPKCNGLFAPTNFSRHERKCTGRAPNRERVASKSRMRESVTRNPKDETLKEKLLKILLDPLADDPCAHEIYADLCLQQLSERYAFMHSNNPTALRNDRQHLRRLARLLVEIREVDLTILDFEDCILNVSYDSVIEAVYRICGLDRESAKFGKPSLAQVLRSAITMLVRTLENYYLNSKKLFKESIQCKRTDRFLTIHNQNYGIYIGRAAGRHRLHRKTRQQTPLPEAQDIRLFSTFIIKEANEAFQKLTENEFSYKTWLRLGQAELARIILFNRRRVSEVSLMQVDLFQNRKRLDTHKRERLTILEKALADNFETMALLGKRSHVLHVLLDKEQCRHLELFLRFRELAGVEKTNEYLFGVPTRVLYIDGSSVIRKFSIECGAKNPHLLRATYLRKQVATMSQLLALNDNEIGQIARFMGHSKEVHNNFYRQDEQMTQVTSWAKFLSLAADENVNKYKGMTLSEIVNIAGEHPEWGQNIDETVETNLNQVPLEEPSPDDVTNIALEMDNFNPDLNEENYTDKKEEREARKKEKKKKCIPSSKSQTPKKRSNPKNRSTPKKMHNSLVSPKKKQTTPTKSPTIQAILTRIANTPPRRKLRRVPFSVDEVRLMTLKFTGQINSKSLAPLGDCEYLVDQYPEIFSGRSGRDVYNWVQYQRNKKKNRK